MMFLRKLCRLNGASSQHNHHTNNNNNERNNYNSHSQRRSPQLNRVRLRTPPPNYNQVTPPPSYSSRQSVEQCEREAAELPLDGRQLYEEVNANVLREAEAEAVHRRQEDAGSSNHDAAAVRRRQQQKRRRRQQLEQQQRIFTQSSSSSSDSDCSGDGGRIRRRHERQRILKDVYCPDLLNACSLILTSQHTSRESFSSCSSSEAHSDYAEIADRLPDHANSRLAAARPARSTPELRLQRVRVQADLHTPQQRPGQQQRQRRGATNALATPHNEHNSNEDNEDTHTSNQRQAAQEMGQHLSLRRPRISLTWVLREQQQQQQQQSEQQPDESNVAAANSFNNNGVGYISGVDCKSGEAQSTYSAASTTLVTKRRPKAKNPSSGEALNGYATTPKAHPSPAAPRKFFSNQNLLEFQEKRDASKELLLVCTPNRLPPAVDAGDCTTKDALASAKRRNEIKKKFANRLAVMQASSRAADGVEAATLHVHGSALQRDTPTTRSLKGTYSEPSLMAASEGNHRRHRHRKRRERHRVQKFGYEIRNVDEFLTRCSLAAPGNIPVVLSTSSTLYQTRPGGYQVEIPLPLGMVVNAVFKNQNWLYVQTPHAEEGYVGYAYCLPLGILPPAARGGGTANGAGSASKPTPCWESNGDVFPHPCGNMTDSEKEIHLRGGTRSDGARTPRGKRSSADVDDGPTEGAMVAGAGSCSEQRVDKLYLRAASQPKLAEKAYAQLRSTKMMAATASNLNDEYVVLQQQQQNQQQQHKTKLHVQKHLEQQQQQQQLLLKQQQYQRLQQQQLQQQHFVKSPPITNGHNGQHLHPSVGNGVHLPRSSSFNSHQVALQAAKHFAQHSSLRQTLVAINTDYATEGITVKKGEIVTLCECRLAKDQRQWFYVKTRDGREGYIPAEVAGHGYL